MVGHGLTGFDHTEEIRQRLRYAPVTASTGVEAGERVSPRWTLKSIRSSFDWMVNYSLSGVWRVLQRARVGVRQSYPHQYSPDPDYVIKEQYLLDCLRRTAQHPERYVTLFLDEMGFFRWPQSARDWMPQAPVEARQVTCADNNRQWRIVGLLNALSGQVTYLDNYIVGRKVLQQLYPLVVKTYPDAQRIYVVQDNWSIHNHPDVLEVVAQFPQLELLWLPTYAHWLNPIEKLWRWLRQTVLHLHPWASHWQTLLDQLHAFLNQFAHGSRDLLRYVGLLGDGKLASAIRLSHYST